MVVLYNNHITQEQIQWLESSVPLTNANYIMIRSIINRNCNNYAKVGNIYKALWSIYRVSL